MKPLYSLHPLTATDLLTGNQWQETVWLNGTPRIAGSRQAGRSVTEWSCRCEMTRRISKAHLNGNTLFTSLSLDGLTVNAHSRLDGALSGFIQGLKHFFISSRPLLVTLVFYALGMATLLPWNFFITAETYWQYTAPQRERGREGWGWSNATLTPLQLSFTPRSSSCPTCSCTVFLLFTSAIVRRVREMVRQLGSLVLSLATMVIITLFTFIDTDSWQFAFFVITMILIAILNVCVAVLQGSSYGLAGLFPASCMSGMLSGQAISGIFSSLARIISLLVGEEPVVSGLVFFVIADVFPSSASWVMFYMNEMHQHSSTTTPGEGRARGKKEQAEYKSDTQTYISVLKKPKNRVNLDADCAFLSRPGSGHALRSKSSEASSDETAMLDHGGSEITIPSERQEEPQKKQKLMIASGEDLKEDGAMAAQDSEDEECTLIWLMAHLGGTLFDHLMIYPAVVVYVTSVYPESRWTEEFFQPTVTFLLFNVGDTLGREITRWWRWPGARGWQLHVFGAARLVFLPLLMLCHGENKTFPTLLDHDAYYIVLMFFFAFTNGYVGTLTMIYYPSLVEPNELEVGGAIMAAMMGIGMVVGSLLSPAFVALWGPV
nr:equilibrative nucleoside transporter 1-like [Penaeus vannamei]